MSAYSNDCFGIYWSYSAKSYSAKYRKEYQIRNYVIAEILRKFYTNGEGLNQLSMCRGTANETGSELSSVTKEYLEKSPILIIIVTYNYELIENNNINHQEIECFLGKDEKRRKKRRKNIFVFVPLKYQDLVQDSHLSKYNLIFFEISSENEFSVRLESENKYERFRKKCVEAQTKYNNYQILIDNLSDNELFFKKVIKNLTKAIREIYPPETKMYHFLEADQTQMFSLRRGIEKTYIQIILYSCHSQIKILKERLEIYEECKSTKTCIFHFIYNPPKHKIKNVDFFDCSKGIYNNSCCKNFVERYLLDIKGDNENE